MVFDTNHPKQATLLRAFRMSFGKRHAHSENLDPPRYRCVSLLPGGVREVLR
jgi:hypothetical protein